MMSLDLELVGSTRVNGYVTGKMGRTKNFR